MMTLFKQTVAAWLDDNVPMLAAALAYYTVFSLAPLLIIIIAVLGLFVDQAQVTLLGQIQELFGQDIALTISKLIDERNQTRDSVLASVLGGLLLLFAATGVFSQLQNALNAIWGVEPAPKRGGLGYFVRVRVLSFGMVLVVGFLLLISLIINTLLSALHASIEQLLPGGAYLWQGLHLLFSIAVITLLFGLIFKVLPDVVIRWRDVMVGALFTSVIFVLGKSFIGLYLGNSGIASNYGAAGSLVLILLWVYFSSQLILFGAEFTYVYSQRYGAGVEPAAYAVESSDDFAVGQG